MELPGESRSAREIEALWDYLDTRLSGARRSRRVPAVPPALTGSEQANQIKVEGRA